MSRELHLHEKDIKDVVTKSSTEVESFQDYKDPVSSIQRHAKEVQTCLKDVKRVVEVRRKTLNVIYILLIH